jgi:hypothetical protein
MPDPPSSRVRVRVRVRTTTTTGRSHPPVASRSTSRPPGCSMLESGRWIPRPTCRWSLAVGRSTTHPPEQQTADNADRADKGQSPQITQIPHPAGRSSSSSKSSSPSRPRGLHRAIRSATLCESQWIPGALHPPAPWDSGRIQGDWQDREIPSHPRRAVRCHARAIRAANCRAQPLSARGLSFGWVSVGSTRPLPGTLPAGAPLDNVGTW